MRRIPWPMLVAVAVAGVLVASCSSTQDAQRDTAKTPSSDVREHDIEEVAEKAIDDLGSPPKASVAVLVAADDGYSMEQIVEAILDGTLTDSGEITGQEPEGDPQDAIADGRGVLLAFNDSSRNDPMRLVAEHTRSPDSRSSLRRSVSDIEDLYEKRLVEGRTKAWTVWTISALSVGYSTRQITERLILNPNQKPDFLAPSFVAVIPDDKGGWVKPEHPPAWLFDGRKVVEEVSKEPEVSEKAKAVGALGTVWIVGAAAAGYGPDQINEAIIFGTAKTCPTQSVPEQIGQEIPTVPCIVEDGKIVRPVNAEEWVFDEDDGDGEAKEGDAGSEDSAAADRSRKYKGTGTVTRTFVWDSPILKASGECVKEGVPFEAELKTDGTAVVTFFYPISLPGGKGECQDIGNPGAARPVSGKWKQDGSLELAGPDNPEGTPMKGSWDENTLRISDTSDYPQPGSSSSKTSDTWDVSMKKK